MRKWLYFLLALAVVYALSKLNTQKRRKKYPLLKRINFFLNVIVWVLLVSYVATFLHWLITEVL